MNEKKTSAGIKDSPKLEGVLKLGLSEQDRREVFLKGFPELAHISDRSSREDRIAAFARLHKRLGIRPFPDSSF